MPDQDDTFPDATMSIPVLQRMFRGWKTIDILSFSLSSIENARMVRAAADLPPLFVDINLLLPDYSGVKQEKCQGYITLFEMVNNTYDLVFEWMISYSLRRRDESKVKMNGIEIHFENVDGELDLEYNNVRILKGNENAQVEAIISHLSFVFPHVTGRNIFVTFGPHHLDYQTCLRSITETKHLIIKPSINLLGLEKLMENLKVTKSFTNKNEDDQFYPVDRLCCSALIDIKNGVNFDGSFLKKWNCRVILKKTRLQTEDFFNFLKEWKNSAETLRNIDYLFIRHPWGVKKFGDDVGAVKWDPLKRPKDYELNGRLEDLSSGLDIMKPDGLIGTILQVTDDEFQFFVWHNL